MALVGGMFCVRIFWFILLAGLCVSKLPNGLHRKLSAEEEKHFSREFRLHNKPSTKIIKTVYGERYSCVDFYQQPAFDHPLLRNHTYTHQMKISSVEMPNQNISSGGILDGLWANGEGCPAGTVPIKKYTKTEFIRHKLFQQQISLSEDSPHPPGQFRAAVHTISDPNKKYFGCSGKISVYNLPVTDSQYTAGYMTIKAVDDSFQVGWMVNPFLYHDRETRLFLITRIGISQCFNTLCPGFVITNPRIPLDFVVKPVSQRGSKTYDINFTIVRNLEKQQWQLQVGEYMVGFWPNNILQGLSGPAEYCEWGGEAYSPSMTDGPGMGSGFFPSGDTKTDGFIRNIETFNDQGNIVGNEVTETYSDDNNYYKVVDYGYVNDVIGHVATFGGPGPRP